MKAARTGNVASIKLLLNKGAKSSITQKDDRSYTALHYAAESGNAEAIKLLLDEGAKPLNNDLNEAKKSPLNIAVEKGNLDSVKLLWQNGGEKSFQRRDWEYETILYSAVSRSHSPSVVKFLLDHGAASSNNKHLTRRDTGTCYFKHGQSMLDEPEAHSRRPVGSAVLRENKEILKLLLEAGAKVNYMEEERNTPLHIAANRSAPIGIIELLLKHGAKQSLEWENAQGKTPLDLARARENLELINYLETAKNADDPKDTSV